MKRSLTVTIFMLVSAVLLVAGPVLAAGTFFQGFETDSAGWFDNVGTIAKVPSGTGGIASAAGGFRGEITGEGPFTRWGGYESVFPPEGYVTQLDLYLNMNENAVLGTDKRLDFSSAISNPAGGHRRDFVFSLGTDPSTVGQWAVSASNNTPGWPSNPGRSPLFISVSGWYTLRHTFLDDGAGVLKVVMEVLDSSGTVLGTWTLTDPSDVIGVTVGGNRYGWFVNSDFPTLAIDNSEKLDINGCVFVTAGSTRTLQGDCITDDTIAVPDGFTLDGAGYTITAVDPIGGHFTGGIVENGGATAYVTNVTITTSNLANVCDGGDDRLRGILFDGAAGSITNNRVLSIKQGASGCQEGNAIEVRNEPFDNTGPDLAVTITGNTVTDYQKTGIIANGSVAATISGNVVTGAGPVNYIAQNGIQVGFGGTADIRGNTISGNAYTPADTVACGLLVFEADGVRTSKNTQFGNERDLCNFGKGGGNFNPNP
jgi:hypothetical protein